MTKTISIRLRRSKAELEAVARPNVNAWVNDLIDQALEPTRTNWDAHFERRRKRKPAFYAADEVRKASR
jgi:hypothetical protein